MECRKRGPSTPLPDSALIRPPLLPSSQLFRLRQEGALVGDPAGGREQRGNSIPPAETSDSVADVEDEDLVVRLAPLGLAAGCSDDESREGYFPSSCPGSLQVAAGGSTSRGESFSPPLPLLVAGEVGR